MLNKLKWTAGVALVAASQLASADIAEVRLTNLTLTASAPGWWDYIPKEVTWVPETAGTSAGLDNPSFYDEAHGWHGNAMAASVTDGSAVSKAQLTAVPPGSSDLNGVTALASVHASGGQGGWANAQVFSGQILVPASTTITISTQIANIQVSGTTAQAFAYVGFCSFDGDCNPANYAEAFIDASWPTYSGPSTLTTSWTNPSSKDNTWVLLNFGATASVSSIAAPVPEPATYALWLAGLVGIGIYRRRT